MADDDWQAVARLTAQTAVGVGILAIATAFRQGLPDEGIYEGLKKDDISPDELQAQAEKVILWQLAHIAKDLPGSS